MKTRSICGYAVIAAILATTILSLGLLGNAQAQNTTASQQQQQQQQTANPEQIKAYLTEAIQAIDSGNNTQALERVDLAGDQLGMLTGTESVDDDEDEDEGEIEEGPGEDADEAGDVDTNDEEDTP